MLDRLSKNSFILGFFLLLISIAFGALFTLPALMVQWFKTIYSPQPSNWQSLIPLALYVSNLLISSFILGYFYAKYNQEFFSLKQRWLIPASFIMYGFLIGESIALIEKQKTRLGTLVQAIKAQAGTGEGLMHSMLSILFCLGGALLILVLSKWALVRGNKAALRNINL